MAKSLVQVDRRGGEIRYRMLHTLLLFGREQLQTAGELEALRRRHAGFFAGLCARGPAAFRGVQQLEWIQDVHREVDNLNDALSWSFAGADVPLGQRMLAGLGPGWFYSGRADEGWRWLRRGLETATDGPVALRAELATYASYLGLLAGLDPVVAHDYGELAVTLCRTCVDDDAEGSDRLAVALMSFGRRWFLEGDPAAARRCWTEAFSLFDCAVDGWSQAMAAHMAGRIAQLDGDVAAACHEFGRAVALCEENGVWWAVAVLASETAHFALELGRPHEAIDVLHRGLRAAALPRMETATAVLTSQLGAAHLAAGDRATADRLTSSAVVLATEANTLFSRAVVLANRTRVVLALGRIDEAVETASSACAAAEAAGAPWLAEGPRRILESIEGAARAGS